MDKKQELENREEMTGVEKTELNDTEKYFLLVGYILHHQYHAIQRKSTLNEMHINFYNWHVSSGVSGAYWCLFYYKITTNGVYFVIKVSVDFFSLV